MFVARGTCLRSRHIMTIPCQDRVPYLPKPIHTYLSEDYISEPPLDGGRSA